MNKNITIYDIAREAKVSPSTVSRVLTGNARVSEEKTRRVKKLIKKYNYQPNALARSLLTKSSNTIGVILPSVDNPFFASVFMEVEKLALARGYSVILCNSVNTMLKNDYKSESMYLKMLVEKRVDGIIFTGGRANRVKTDKDLANEMNSIIAQIPVVMINGSMQNVDCYKVQSDEREGMFSAIEHLVSLGHRDIGFIGGQPSITSTYIKQKALKDALEYFNLSYEDQWIIYSDFSIDSGARALKKLLAKKDIPTAVVAVNDLVAIGAINYAMSKGLNIPDDISIIGFDNSYLCDIVTPKLTSVSHNICELAKTAVEMLCADDLDGDISKEKIVKTKLISRNSCASPRKNKKRY